MSSPLQLPADLPLDEAGLARHSEYRLEPVIEMLRRQLQTWLDTPRAQRRTPLRLGLFGGLGQGKSTALGVALARLSSQRSAAQRWRDLLFGPRVAHFDVSFFKADDLEWRFFTAVLLRRALANALKLLLLAVLAALALRAWTPLDQVWASLVLLLTLPPALTGALKHAGKAAKSAAGLDQVKGLYVAWQDLLIQSLANALFALPDVVVVDDLDRARVEQQRSFLRALTRYSRRMGFAVVVCMDESELLASAPNPEAPEEMLRKNLTAELRVPERSREDVALLAAISVREFAAANFAAAPALSEGLRSVQFVGDFARVLMLDTAKSPNSPRKLQRLLTQVAMQASQLGLSHVDDLSALLRLEGLYRLAPGLRQQLDALGRALEVNRLQAFEPLLKGAALAADREAEAREFFLRTRMMQPALRDGWFRLLGGFGGLHVAAASTAWTVSWQVGRRSVDLLRVLAGAASHDAGGYPHSLTLAANSAQDIFTFELPGGTREDFRRGELPPAVLRSAGEYDAHCWLAWLCALRAAPPAGRHALCRRAWSWAGALPPARRRAALDLVLREALADCQMWDQLQPSQRYWWWDRVHDDKQLPLEHVFSVALRDSDFADAWRALGRADGGHFRDGRKVLSWWSHLSPLVEGPRLGSSEIADPVFGSAVWPAPDVLNANTARARNELARHLAALAALRAFPAASQRVPDPQPLREALRRALDELLPQHLLELMAPLVFDSAAPPGERWSLEAPRRWVDDIRHHRLHGTLQLLAVDPDAAAVRGLLDGAGAAPRRALLVVALLSGWQPAQPRRLCAGVDEAELHELRQLLEDRGSPCAWL